MNNINNYGATLGMIIALLVAIIIGVLIYYEMEESAAFSGNSESFSADRNGTAFSSKGAAINIVNVSLQDPIEDRDTSHVNVTIYNSTTIWNTGFDPADNCTLTTPKLLQIEATNWKFSSVRVHYNDTIAYTVDDSVNPQAQSVFTLAPIIAIVVIAGIILSMVILFGSGGKQEL